MKLPGICIQKPVLATVLSLVLVVLGMMSYQRLEMRFFPKLKLPVVTVQTYYQGASADLMENQVTTKLENALSGIDNIQYMTSSSSTSWSTITIQFRLGGNLESEAASVRDKVASQKQYLPPDAQTPNVTVGTTGNQIIGMGFTASNKTPQDIRNYLNQYVQPILRQLKGVGAVQVLGSSDYAMRIWLDPAKMASLGVSVSDVKTALTANNIYFPAGSIQGATRNYGIVSDTQLKNAQQFGDIVVKSNGANVIRMKDIAKVKLGIQSFYDYPLLIGKKSGIALLVEPLQEANPIAVANTVRKAFNTQIKSQLPPGMHASIIFDQSTFLQSSINETFLAIVEAIALVILVVFLFLGSVRAASIPIITIPVSLISVFSIMLLLGFTLNIMSLLGMVLAIGLVVDDAIVMLENIHRHIEEGFSPFEAAIKGSKEIAYAVLAMSLTLIAVYAPVGLVQGFTSRLFQEFAFTLAGAVVISGFVALTLTPMMCSKILKGERQEGRLIKITDHIFEKIAELYHAILIRLLNKRMLVIIALLIISGIGYLLYSSLPADFLPVEDAGELTVSVSTPTGSSIQYTENNLAKINDVLNKIPEISHTMTQISTASIHLFVILKPWGQRKKTANEIVGELNPLLKKIPGVNATAYIPDIVSYGEQGSDVTLNFMTAGNYKDLLGPIDKLLSILKPYPGLLNTNSNLKFDSQQYAITINRDLAATLGVSIQDIADTITAMMSGNHWSDVQAGNTSYQVIVQMARKYLKNFTAMKQIYVAGSAASAAPTTAPPSTGTTPPAASSAPASNMVPLSSLVTLTPRISQGTLYHFNRMRSGAINALLAPGYTESQVLNYINQQLPKVLNSKVRVAYSGKAQQFLDSQGSMTGIMFLAFVFIYLVLSAQFGSFLDPFIILIVAPFSMVGALFALWLDGGTINLYSQIGLVTLIGLVSKHGILITQFINDLRRQGMEMREAIIQATKIRLRPVLMTTMAMIFGTLPLALASGPGSVGRQNIGWVIVGGLFFGMFFSLVVVPIAYSYIGGLKKIVTEHKVLAD